MANPPSINPSKSTSCRNKACPGTHRRTNKTSATILGNSDSSRLSESRERSIRSGASGLNHEARIRVAVPQKLRGSAHCSDRAEWEKRIGEEFESIFCSEAMKCHLRYNAEINLWSYGKWECVLVSMMKHDLQLFILLRIAIKIASIS